MLLKIILILTITPLVELLVLVRIAELTSFSFTAALVIGTGIAGGILAKMEGLRVLGRIQDELNSGRLPGDALLDGAMVLVAGALLLTPGVITDSLGFALLVPPARNVLKKYLKRKFQRMLSDGKIRIYKDMGFRPMHDEPPPGAPPIEGEDDEQDKESKDEPVR